MLKGKGVSKGIGIGKAKILGYKEKRVGTFKVDDPEKEVQFFDECLKAVISDTEKMAEKASGTQKEIIEAYLMILEDPTLVAETKRLIEQERFNAGYATKKGFETVAETFKKMSDPYLAARAADIEDMKKRVISKIVKDENINLSDLPENTILIGKEITSSDTAQLNMKNISGIISEVGSENSHVSIIARTYEIPLVLGVEDISNKVKNNEELAINGETGEVYLEPTEEEIEKLTKEKEENSKNKQELLKYKNRKTITKDGFKAEVCANIGNPKDMEKVLENGAEGIGLFRSEFLYMDSTSMPTEEEQFEAYKKVLEASEGKRVIIRTLDIGGDKKLKYFRLKKEDNPFLGYRAIRICLKKPEIFKVQLRALYRASVYGKLAIMLPMISSIEELRKAKAIMQEVKDELKSQNIKFDNKVKVGIMVEIPSSAIIAELIGKECDFFSIGTNDLIQYTVAAERGNTQVADIYTKYNPGVIKLIKMAIDGAHKNKIFCGMCGEAAGDELFIPLLVGLGLDEFSMNPNKILNTRKIIRNIEHKKCKKLAQEILKLSSATEIKERLIQFAKENNIIK